MASIEKNMRFVKELLTSKSITNEQKNTIIDLLKIEINNELKKSHSNINLLKKLSKKEYVSDIIYHYPKETVGLLNKFSEGSITTSAINSCKLMTAYIWINNSFA